jgi:hypothetical protein
MRASSALIFIAIPPDFVSAHGKAKPIDITKKSESDCRHYVGKPVIIKGRFSLRGKFGAYVDTGRAEIYIVSDPSRSFTWDPKIYDPLEGRGVIVTGVLHLYKAPPFDGDSAVARPPDYLFFELDHSAIKKSSR